MVTSVVSWLRRQTAAVVAVLLLVGLYQLGKLPTASAGDLERIASGFAFTPFPIEVPGGFPTQRVRDVNRDFAHLEAWVSSVGAGVAMNDLDGDGLANDLCLTDPRIDETVVTPAPGVPGADRYPPFVLDPGELPVTATMAPMGCVPGDFNADGRMDILVYYWGRMPIIYLAQTAGEPLSAASYRPVEMVPGVAENGSYSGPLWNTNAVAVADLDGDGYEDIVIGNYWPHGPVLDPERSGGVAMPDSLSYALNGGETYIYRSTGRSGGAEPAVSYELASGALESEWANGWVLAAAAADLDGDLLPELYLAHDFGRDRLLHNRSRPGEIRFALVEGDREPMVPKSKVLGHSSFKGMGVDIADLNADGLNDIFVSNITTSFGIQESNFAFVNGALDHSDASRQFAEGRAPFRDWSAGWGLAWVGWGWDVKLADLDNNGQREVVQTNGFVKGKVNRWAQLQEVATTNDSLLRYPHFWPNVELGDDIAGHQSMALFVRDGEDGGFANISDPLGLAIQVPTRGVAFGDATGDGRMDMAIARQWDESVFYQNAAPAAGAHLNLRLLHELPDVEADPDPPDPAVAMRSPVVGAQVTVTTPDGRTLTGHVDGGSGHSGKRSHEVAIGLGDVQEPMSVRIAWRDRSGEVREGEIELAPGTHTLRLGNEIREEAS